MQDYRGTDKRTLWILENLTILKSVLYVAFPSQNENLNEIKKITKLYCFIKRKQILTFGSDQLTIGYKRVIFIS